jgi:hypothetical protein
VQYLSVEESVRRLRAAGFNARPQTLRQWIREQRIRDVWILGRHAYIYEAEIDALIAQQHG